MWRSTQRRGRQFPPQVSKEELLERTRQTLSEKGVDYVSQAKYVVQIAGEVVGYNEPIFSSLQPEIKLRSTPGWQHAYSLLINYLQENGMEQTLEVIDIELQGQRLPQAHVDEETDTYMANLLKISKQLKRKTFSSRVAEFTGKYKTRKTISQTKKSSPTRPTPSAQTMNPATTKRTSLSISQNSAASAAVSKPAQKPAAKPQIKEEPIKQTDPKPRTSLLQTKPQTQTKPLNRTTQPQNTQPQQQPKKSPWDPVPMAEPSKPPQNSMESIDFDSTEEEDYDDDVPIQNPFSVPKTTTSVPRYQPKQQKDDSGYSDSDDDIPTVSNQSIQKNQTALQQAPKPALSGWDAQPMDDSFVDDGEDLDNNKYTNQPDDDVESASFDLDDDLSLGDD